MNCKTCGTSCIVKVSKSQSNFGKEFYSCPGGCTGWVGWVDQSMNVQKPQIERAPAKLLPGANKDDYYINADGDVGCKSCGMACIIRRSKSPKNMNREYYGCQNNCNVWNGWVEEADKIVIPEDKLPKVKPEPKPQVQKSSQNPPLNVKQTISSKPPTKNTVTKNTQGTTQTTTQSTTQTMKSSQIPQGPKVNKVMILPDDDDYDIDENDEY